MQSDAVALLWKGGPARRAEDRKALPACLPACRRNETLLILLFLLLSRQRLMFVSVPRTNHDENQASNSGSAEPPG